MISDTISNEGEYIRLVRNILLFTHLCAYNGQAQLWKDEDIDYIRNLDRREKISPELLKQSFDVYKRAKKEYGDIVATHRDNYRDLTSHEVLYAFGFISPDDDETNYIASDLDLDLKSLKKNENYPKSFPVIVVQGDGDFKILCIYPSDFNNSIKIDDFSWLEKNIRDFWSGKGKGSCW